MISKQGNYLISQHWKYQKEDERQHLRKLAKKITKVPEKINIPIEYMVNQKEDENGY